MKKEKEGKRVLQAQGQRKWSGLSIRREAMKVIEVSTIRKEARAKEEPQFNKKNGSVFSKKKTLVKRMMFDDLLDDSGFIDGNIIGIKTSMLVTLVNKEEPRCMGA
ncbi:unnamed protein product [Dovyalis caffra]|uniref:Uncharacterized protein n=1 Tax=Dovyalis caffra TaxID=77055 RepID=A0AAV1S5Z9_9ROSI|nr:unnamed protein product [Dovyalis caffra]